ncbi:MAG: hypothetical protein C4342_05340 [Armatimonadota bacterium]
MCLFGIYCALLSPMGLVLSLLPKLELDISPALSKPRPAVEAPAPAPVLDPKARSRRPAFSVRVTYYQALPSQTDGNPNVAACGPNLEPWVQVALSRDLFFHADGRRRCGQRVRLVFENGRELLGVVNDTMNRRYRKQVDVLVAAHEPARRYGVAEARLILE